MIKLKVMAHIMLQVLLTLVSFFWITSEAYSNTDVISSSNSTALYFGLMLSLSGDDQSSGALAGVQAAVGLINSRDDVLPGYSLNFTPTVTDSKVMWIDTSFSLKEVMMFIF